jgi:hypothetical protein
VDNYFLISLKNVDNLFNLWKSGLIFVDNVEKKNLDRKFKDKLVNKNVDNLWNSSKKIAESIRIALKKVLKTS